MSAVRLRLGIPPACDTCNGSNQAQHIILTIRGVALNSNASAQNDSPDWQELLRPELDQSPLQIDLMESNAAQGVQEPFRATAVIPAGIYRQLRLRFAPNHTAADDQLSEKNRCGGGIFNCIVMADGSVHPLQLDAASSEIRIMPDRMDGAALSFFSDANADLIIEMKLTWELSPSANGSVQLVPTLTSSAKVRRIGLSDLRNPD
ncbi:MAG TPA: DUF4382 domain-containing protein [Candidatus Acidoferrum sp.]|nr:DUF4382 domain-containing protein [Candidatus Acidoferrum sp.]